MKCRLTECLAGLCVMVAAATGPHAAHAREPLSDEGYIFRAMDFPEGKPIWNSGQIEKQRLTQLWEEARTKRSFALIRTFRNEEKKRTVYTFLSEPVPVSASAYKSLSYPPPLQGPGQWVEYWEKMTVVYDDLQSRPAADTLASSVQRFIFRCAPAAMATVANLYFESTDATGAPESIYSDYSHPFKVENLDMMRPLYVDRYRTICESSGKIQLRAQDKSGE